ncbi:MAG: catalase [Leptospiraceae bacterium]|nr:catalase [Leptospiraceae bacterium]MCP5510582.1 catalase [Leptospiraceae bacterium]
MAVPSTEWEEIYAPDEEERFSEYAEKFILIQKEKSKKYGKGRALHRKQILALKAELEILDSLPEYAKSGLFQTPGKYSAYVRLSNGGTEIQADQIPDIRGFSIKVLGVDGEGALGARTKEQDFTLINREAFAFPRSDEFVGLVLAVSGGPFSMIPYLWERYGLWESISKLLQLGSAMNRPFSGFATESFFSAAPIACDPYACRVRLLPAQTDEDGLKLESWADNFRNHLRKGDLKFDLQLQFYTDEKNTPIEDASKNWEESISPYISVARLTIPSNQPEGEKYNEFSSLIEESIFDPWNALFDHRPLGDVMRTRKVIYFASQKERGLHSS